MKDFSHTYGEDYFDTFVPTSKMESIGVILSLDACYGWNLRLMLKMASCMMICTKKFTCFPLLDIPLNQLAMYVMLKNLKIISLCLV